MMFGLLGIIVLALLVAGVIAAVAVLIHAATKKK